MFNYTTTHKQTGSSLKNYLALTGVLEGEETDIKMFVGKPSIKLRFIDSTGLREDYGIHKGMRHCSMSKLKFIKN